MVDYDIDLPPTISICPGVTMTFLRDKAYLARVHVLADAAEEFFVPEHWHETHDELFHVVEGRLEVLIGAEKRFYTAADGEIFIQRGVAHSLHVVKGEACIFEEKTEPMDTEKELFFRNLLASGSIESSFFKVMQIMHHGDTRPVLPFNVRWLEKLLVTVVGYYIAPSLGYKLKIPNQKKVT